MTMDAKVNYSVTVHEEEGSYWAEVDELPGCFAAGDTLDELWVSLGESIAAYLSTPDSEVHVKVKESEIVSESHATETRVLVEC